MVSVLLFRLNPFYRFCGTPRQTERGHVVPAIPIDKLREVMKKYGR